MKVLLSCLLLFAGAMLPSTAGAYSLDCSQSDKCTVTCDNKTLAGTIYWNGSRWSDGIRSDTDKYKLAQKIVDAQGSACK
jgi:hypothetical protein